MYVFNYAYNIVYFVENQFHYGLATKFKISRITDLWISNVATVDECIRLVNDKRIGEPSIEEVYGRKVDWSMINGMTYMSTGSKDCYAEINDKRIGDYGCTNNCQTCIFIGKLRNNNAYLHI